MFFKTKKWLRHFFVWYSKISGAALRAAPLILGFGYVTQAVEHEYYKAPIAASLWGIFWIVGIGRKRFYGS